MTKERTSNQSLPESPPSISTTPFLLLVGKTTFTNKRPRTVVVTRALLRAARYEGKCVLKHPSAKQPIVKIPFRAESEQMHESERFWPCIVSRYVPSLSAFLNEILTRSCLSLFVDPRFGQRLTSFPANQLILNGKTR